MTLNPPFYNMIKRISSVFVVYVGAWNKINPRECYHWWDAPLN
jgi:hypothetical protein